MPQPSGRTLKALTASRGAKRLHVEYLYVDRDRPLAEVLRDLRASGYAISADKLQRLRPFGLRTKRVGRHYYVSAATVRDLRYVLDVEAAFGLARNHDALALELAYRGYLRIPWKRVHTAAQKEVRYQLNRIDRAFHRLSKSKKAAFSETRVIALSKQLARHLIPDRKLDEDISNGLNRELLEKVFEMLLLASYFDRPFAARDIRKLLQATGLPEPAALTLAQQIASLLNSERSLFRIDKNSAFRKAVSRAAKASKIRATVDMMRKLRALLDEVGGLNRNPVLAGVTDYPNFEHSEEGRPKVEVALHAVYYACVFALLNHPEAQATIKRYLAGEALDMSTPLAQLGAAIDMIPKIVRMQYEP